MRVCLCCVFVVIVIAVVIVFIHALCFVLLSFAIICYHLLSFAEIVLVVMFVVDAQWCALLSRVITHGHAKSSRCALRELWTALRVIQSHFCYRPSKNEIRWSGRTRQSIESHRILAYNFRTLLPYL